jgi:hypothetical protein
MIERVYASRKCTAYGVRCYSEKVFPVSKMYEIAVLSALEIRPLAASPSSSGFSCVALGEFCVYQMFLN